MASLSLVQPGPPKPGLPPRRPLVGLGHALCLQPVPLHQILTPLGAGYRPPAMYPRSRGESDPRRPLIREWTVAFFQATAQAQACTRRQSYQVPGPLVPRVPPALCGTPQPGAASRSPEPFAHRETHFSVLPDSNGPVVEASRAAGKQ